MNATLASPFLSRTIFVAHLALGVGIAACSSNSGTGGSGGGGAGATSTSTSSSGSTSTSSSASSSSSGGSNCAPGPGYDKGKMPLTVMSGDATILDANDMPVAGQPVFLCGVDICSPPAKTDATGHAAVQYNKALDRPAFKFGDALTYAEFGIPVSMAQASLGTLHTVKLPAMGATMTAGKSVTSGNVTVTLQPGTAIDYSILYATPADQQLRAAAMPAMLAKPLVDPKLNLEVVYGVAPTQTGFCPAAAVSVPNDPMWPAGTAVEFYIHSVAVGQEWAPYAGWAKVSDGAVSADGKTIATADGQGLPVLEVFGIQKKP